MLKKNTYFSFFFFFLCLCNANELCFAQNESINTNDSIKVQDSSFKQLQDIIVKQPIKEKNFEMTKSPLGAIWRSIVLPGWGQIYVENYWKAPLFFSAFGACIYLTLDNHFKFIDASDIYDRTKEKNPNDPMLPILKNRREFYRDNRDQSAFFLVGVYIIAAIDAYVGAHLYDFDISDDFSLKIVPLINNDWVQFQLIISW